MRATFYKSMNGWIVSVYKVFGFGVLISLVVGMVSFLAVNLFFMFDRSWIIPVILSPQSDRVVATNMNYMEQIFQVDKIRTEKAAIEAELGHIHKAIRLHEQFQTNFVRALQVEALQKQAKLARLHVLQKALGANSKSLASDSNSYRKLTQKQLAEQYKARLIAQDDLIKGNYLVSQLAASDLSQRERFADLVDRMSETEGEIKAQSESTKILKNAQTAGRSKDLAATPLEAGRSAFNVDVLMREQQYLTAEIAKSELASKIPPLEMQLEKIDGLLAQHEEVLARMRASPYIRAAKEPVTIAFVSYDNLPQVKVGAKVMGCYLSFLLCTRTGTVKRVLDGEVTSRHPTTNRDLRGVMVEIELADGRWAEKSALMLNRAPLLF